MTAARSPVGSSRGDNTDRGREQNARNLLLETAMPRPEQLVEKDLYHYEEAPNMAPLRSNHIRHTSKAECVPPENSVHNLEQINEEPMHTDENTHYLGDPAEEEPASTLQ